MRDFNSTEELLAVVRKQQESIDELRQRIDHLQEGQAAKARQPTGDTPIDWLHISGPERLAAWKGLAAFVEMIVERYGLQLELQPCWWEHNDAVEELSALWQIRLNTFQEGKGLGAAMSWQDSFHKSRSRLGPMFVSCREGHVDGVVKRWMTEEGKARFWDTIHAEASPYETAQPVDTPPSPWPLPEPTH